MKDLEEKIASVSDYRIDTNHTLNEAGDFDLYGIVTDSKGLSATKKINVSVKQKPGEPPVEPPVNPPIEPPIIDYVDISGILQDNETDTGKIGEIEVYDDRTANGDGTFTYSNFLEKQILVQMGISV